MTIMNEYSYIKYFKNSFHNEYSPFEYFYAEPWLQYEPLICVLISPNKIISTSILPHLPTHNKPLISSNIPNDIIVFIEKYGLGGNLLHQSTPFLNHLQQCSQSWCLTVPGDN